MNATRCDLVGFGENSVDLVYRLTALPDANGKVRALSCRRLPGGQVATTLCTCAALGLRTRYVGTFGNDHHGTFIRAELEQRGIDTSAATVRYAPNRHAIILVVDGSGERTIVWQRDASLSVHAADVTADAVTGARLLHVDNVDEEASIAAARLARDAGMMVTTDIDHVSGLTPELIAAATFPILAEHVPRALTGATDPERALRAMRADHDGWLCVTLGDQGAMLLVDDRLYRAPAYRVTVTDTTGAGDVFRGALIYSLLKGDDPDTMLRFANAAAAVSCTREGAIGSTPTLADIEHVMS